MPTFIITRGTEAGRRFEFREDIEIGRAPQLAFSINDRGISRRHAGVSVRNGAVTVSDLGSQNGTIVNGQLIRAATRLKDGDEVRVGGVWLKFQQEVEKPDAESSSVQLDDKPQGVIRSITAVDAGAYLADEGDEKPTVETLSKRLKLLYDVSVAIHQILDEETLFALILRKLFEVFPSADRGFILILNPAKNELKPAAVLARPGMSGQIGISRELVWNVVRNRQGIVSVDAMLDGRFQESHSIVAMGLHAVVCVPMMADDEVHGVLAIDSLRSSGAFGKDDMALLVGIAAQAALALTKARLHRQLVGREILERDLALAKKIQARFLPRGEPDPPGWTFQAHYASAFEIGGDFYDFIDLPGNHLAVVIGDVSGKGVAAALYMVKISTEFRTHAIGILEPAELLRRVNRSLARDAEDGMFATCALLILDLGTRRVRVASAGHMPPLVRRSDGSIIEFGVPRTAPLGVNEAAVYTSREFDLSVSDVVVLYTDGISEATDEKGGLFGEPRLVDTISASDGTPEGALIQVLDAIKRFTAGEPQSDDITLICFGPASRKRDAGSTWKMPPSLASS